MSTRDRGGSWASTVLKSVVTLAWSLDFDMMIVCLVIEKFVSTDKSEYSIQTPDIWLVVS